MARRKDPSIIRFAEDRIAEGMLDSQAARAIEKHFKVSLPTAYRYLDTAYQSFAETIRADNTKKKGRIEVMIAQDRARALKRGDLREAGKCIDRLMRLHGLEGAAIVVNNTNEVSQISAPQATVATMTSGQMRAMLEELSAKMAGNAS